MSEAKIFLGLAPSREFFETYEGWRAHWKHLPVRWLEAEDLHITIVPPWHEANPERVKLKLLDFKSSHTVGILLHFNYVSFGPSLKHPRLIWAEGVAPEKLILLKDELEEFLGLEKTAKPLRLHITLARFKEEQFANFPVQDISQNADWVCHVEDILLMESSK